MSVVLVGISHRVAPVELRERVALSPEEAESLAAELAGRGAEAVCLSTCNRTELYLGGEGAAEMGELAVAALAERAGLAASELRPSLYRLEDEAAATHLFRVAAGLDSMVPGEGEILGQVRAAYERGRPGPLVDRLFRQAIHAGKKVRTETAIAENPASVSSAAAALAEQLFGDLASCRVLLVGAGKAAELAARNLVSRGASIAAVANRSPAAAAELAERFGARPVPLAAIAAELPGVDVVLSSTGASRPVLTRADVEPTLGRRRSRPLFLIDIAVPRDLDPAIHQLDGCFLYDIDDLESVVADSLAGRRREAGRAEAIVLEEAGRFQAWQASRDVVPAIASLRALAEEIREHELERARSRLARLTEAERRAVEAVTARIVDKLLHVPTVRMKEAAAGADGAVYADALCHLFGLGDDAGPRRHPRQ
ncbi:MAG TPA: glutamyl-tRNA reductase [Gaiellaceae bacterium]|nr:glutamyl-tRNA reductase [Gaiellaceae bacterium]